MGSRQGRHKKKERSLDSFRVFKLIVYAVLAVAVIAALWYLYLSKNNYLDRTGNPVSSSPVESGSPPP